MPGTLTFPLGDDLKAIVAHARAAAVMRPTYAELYDPALRLDGEEPGDDASPTSDQIDPSRIPKGLWLVMDDGVYLMSAGDPGLPGRDGKANLVVYARECDPTVDDEWWHAKNAIVGGDDGVDKFELEFFEQAIAAGATEMFVEVGEDTLGLAYS